jgi:hypothetical protein
MTLTVSTAAMTKTLLFPNQRGTSLEPVKRDIAPSWGEWLNTGAGPPITEYGIFAMPVSMYKRDVRFA